MRPEGPGFRHSRSGDQLWEAMKADARRSRSVSPNSRFEQILEASLASGKKLNWEEHRIIQETKNKLVEEIQKGAGAIRALGN